jgi:hypothetical protein
MTDNKSSTAGEDKVFIARADFGSPDDAYASEGGYGTSDILKVVNILENSGITCCMTGISALKWFGAGRVRWVSLSLVSSLFLFFFTKKIANYGELLI